MATLTLATVGRNAAVEAATDLLDGGDIQFQTAGDSAVATCTFAATAFGAAATGVVTAAAIADDTNANAGTVTHALLRTSVPAEVMDADVTDLAGGGSFTMTNRVVGTGDTVSVTSLTVTMPAS